MLISAYGSAEQRLKLLEDRLRRSLPPSTPANEISSKSLELISLDAEETGNDYGQHLRETFHQGDVFIDGLSKGDMDRQLTRFIQAFFGRTDIAPTKQEYGMYAAKSAALRSADLSRQVGAAIFTDDGELITQGCNEVPKAMGGTYWDSETPDFRDVRLGYDPNDILKKDILRDLFDRMTRAGLLSESARSLGSLDDMVKKLTNKRTPKTAETDGPLANAQLMDVTEYGRVVHAEMCALCDAARLGRSVKGATLYCTTFPCHNCTKHILASGVKRVVYIEPYPKSKAKELHQNEIEIEKETPGRVSFMPFIGISPHRYRDIFQKAAKRKGADGSAKRWLRDPEQPMNRGCDYRLRRPRARRIPSATGQIRTAVKGFRNQCASMWRSIRKTTASGHRTPLCRDLGQHRPHFLKHFASLFRVERVHHLADRLHLRIKRIYSGLYQTSMQVFEDFIAFEHGGLHGRQV
jgi:deoxycytidylate deaminase